MAPALLRSMLAYRGFIVGSVKREFQSKYRNAMLGAVWTVLNPLAMIVVYTVIFSQVMNSKLPGVNSAFAYSIYLCSGIISWSLFAEVTTRSQSMFLDNANLIKKISFPRISLPLIIALSSLLNFAIIFALFIGFLVLSGQFPGWVALAVVPLLIMQMLLATGLGMILGVLNVFFRDVGQFFTIFLQFWFWLTPVVYPATILPAAIRPLVDWNPMARLIGAYQQVFVHAQAPDWRALAPVALLGIALCVFGLRLFRKRSGEMVDEL